MSHMYVQVNVDIVDLREKSVFCLKIKIPYLVMTLNI